MGAKENIQLVLGMITTLDYLTQINIEEITGSQFGELWIIFGGDPGKAHDLTTPFLPTGTLLVQPTQQRGSSTFTSLSSIPSWYFVESLKRKNLVVWILELTWTLNLCEGRVGMIEIEIPQGLKIPIDSHILEGKWGYFDSFFQHSHLLNKKCLPTLVLRGTNHLARHTQRSVKPSVPQTFRDAFNLCLEAGCIPVDLGDSFHLHLKYWRIQDPKRTEDNASCQNSNHWIDMHPVHPYLGNVFNRGPVCPCFGTRESPQQKLWQTNQLLLQNQVAEKNKLRFRNYSVYTYAQE